MVYVAADEQWRVVKIGCSVNPVVRVGRLNAAEGKRYGVRLRLIRVFEGGVAEERWLRSVVPGKGRDPNVAGHALLDWVDGSPETRAFIEGLSLLPKPSGTGECCCRGCGNTWTQRKVGRPKQCPLCHSSIWDKKVAALSG